MVRGRKKELLTEHEQLADAEAQASREQRGVMKFRVLKDVLGYKAGDEFESSFHAVRLQVKHRSIEPV